MDSAKLRVTITSQKYNAVVVKNLFSYLPTQSRFFLAGFIAFMQMSLDTKPNYIAFPSPTSIKYSKNRNRFAEPKNMKSNYPDAHHKD